MPRVLSGVGATRPVIRILCLAQHELLYLCSKAGFTVVKKLALSLLHSSKFKVVDCGKMNIFDFLDEVKTSIQKIEVILKFLINNQKIYCFYTLTLDFKVRLG